MAGASSSISEGGVPSGKYIADCVHSSLSQNPEDPGICKNPRGRDLFASSSALDGRVSAFARKDFNLYDWGKVKILINSLNTIEDYSNLPPQVRWTIFRFYSRLLSKERIEDAAKTNLSEKLKNLFSSYLSPDKPNCMLLPRIEDID